MAKSLLCALFAASIAAVSDAHISISSPVAATWGESTDVIFRVPHGHVTDAGVCHAYAALVLPTTYLVGVDLRSMGLPEGFGPSF